jgi:Acyl-CoA synthetases (AMP-forming)/AMP-acid ligases II
MFHANAWGLAYACLLSGAALIMPDRDLSPASLVRLIGDEHVTVAGGVPTIWAGLLDYMRSTGGDLSSLRLVVAGGSAVPALDDGEVSRRSSACGSCRPGA